MFEQQSWDSILARMLNRFAPQGVAKQEGSFVYDAMSPVAVELSQAYSDLDRVLEQGFAETSNGVYLDRRAGEHGVTRKPPAKAHGIVKVSGTAGAKIPAGAMFATKNGTLFVAAAEAVITTEGFVKVNVAAEEAGVSGNVPALGITEIIGSIPGVQQAVNEAACAGGYDGETDDALLDRLLTKVRTPATSGNANQYRQWAMEVTGIADAKVFPLWNGNGTVKVVLLDDNRRAPVPELVTQVANHIALVRPIGANVTVSAAVEVPLNIDVDLDVLPGTSLEDAKALITSEIIVYLKGLSFVDPIVRTARIANVILDTKSIVDYRDLKINGSMENIIIPEGSVAVIGTVTVR
ncbi:baseplate J/gp47 family protein [Paenibacillus guangzhouensis]|uniref:baseplate J/gp47 family protein n=1 Tax=Paenibacillus guangzhouensis TaxID=1473112 RepID=UPI0012677365|nr:baseplate J/gp47 family protein [Paenibacillus guangzhouensis]